MVPVFRGDKNFASRSEMSRYSNRLIKPGLIKNLIRLFLVLTLTSTILTLSPSQVSAVGPSAVQALAISSKTATSVTLTWSPPSSGAESVTDYIIQYSVNNSNWTNFNDGASSATGTTVTGLTRGTTYYIRVIPFSTELGTSQSVIVTPANLASAPSSLTISSKTETSLNLSWAAPDNGGQSITDYLIQYSTDSNTWTDLNNEIDTTTTASITGLVRSTEYNLRVAAVTVEGQSLWATTTGTPALPPDPPSNVTFTNKTATTISLSWDAPIDDGGQPVNDYEIEYSIDGTDSWTTFSDGFSTNTTTTITGLTRGTPYQVRVSAITNTGKSTPRQEKSNIWSSVSSGTDFTCATTSELTLWCWGSNDYGRLGTGDYSNHLTPTQIPGTTWNNITTGFNHSCATKTDGTLWCWGSNAHGQLGTSDTNNRSTPTQIPGTTWGEITAGTFRTCATKTDNTLWCWGYNSFGQLGTSDTNTRDAPTRIPGTDWKTITAGNAHNCASKNDHTLWCWGYNGYGQLGTGGTNNRSTPTQIPGNTWNDITAGTSNHACASKTDGTVWCWGYNGGGLLGTGYTNDRYAPTQVPSTNWETIDSGGVHICATKTDRTLWCWGYNTSGQLGTGDTNNRNTPTQVTDVTFASLTPAESPSAPINLTVASKTRNTVTLTWTVGDDGGQPVTDYVVQYSTSGTDWTTFNDGTSTLAEATVTNLLRSTDYQFRVAQTTIEGTSSYSTATSTITGVGPDAPENLFNNAKTATSISFYWSAPTEHGGEPVIDYVIEYSIDGSPVAPVISSESPQKTQKVLAPQRHRQSSSQPNSRQPQPTSP
jgi:alpha-tubulin suppressor-like RCC1 family protein